jgi:hypothetical protein
MDKQQGDNTMKPIVKAFFAMFLVYATMSAQNHIPVPHQIPHGSDRICWGYAMGRAGGKDDGDATCNPVTLIPNSGGIDLTYFDQHNWSDVDLLQIDDILYWPGQHAAYVVSVTKDGQGHVIVDQIQVDHTAAAWDTVYHNEYLPTARQRLSLENPGYFCRRKNVGLYVLNSFGGGNVKVDGTSHTSGLVGAAWWRQIPLEALNQDYQNVYRVWYRWGATTYQNPIYITAASGDSYTANFNPFCDMTFSNSLPGASGGTISVWDTVRNAPITVRMPQNTSFHAIAIDQDINGISYTFSQWADGPTSRDRSVTATQHASYTANFTAKPQPPTNLDQVASVGQHVHLTWVDNPNSNVSTYRIYRHQVGQQRSLVATVSRGVQSWIDPGIVVVGPKEGPEYLYDVCSVYNSVESDNATVSSFGMEDKIAIEGNGMFYDLENESGVPTAYSVSSYPNPFNPSTTLSYRLPQDAAVRLEIYDLIGRKIRSLVDESKSAGYYHVVWNGRDQMGKEVASGVYLYRFSATPTDGGRLVARSGKLVLMR